MKKRPKTKYSIFNNLVFLKTGSIMFLVAFVFCSLMAPMAAQISSFLFIALGMLVAPWVQSDLAEDHTAKLPKPHPTAYVEFSHHDRVDHDAFILSYAQEQLQAQAAEICETRFFRTIFYLPPTRFGVFEHEFSHLLQLKTAYPVRAGPSEIYC